jgi:predicted AlkP superfamily pyrophosphatase or phosphodiesterase
MGIPDSIIARDITIGVRKIWNSIFTIAHTTVSLIISVFFSTLYALILIARPDPLTADGFTFWLTFLIASFIGCILRPKSFRSADFRPEITRKIFEKVVVLNIDGCRLDRFYEAQLPFLTSLQKQGSYFPGGIQTVYRALTNPAFASMLTGVTSEVHGVKSNNFGQTIKVEALPDLVKTKLYGSMHIKHFSKPNWEAKIVSLPTHSIYKSDDIMFAWLSEDLDRQDGTRLFIADISEADFLGHAYGSESRQYLEALKKTDLRIRHFFAWLKEKNLLEGMAIIICSDHGIIRIDHSYLLFKAERYVPFIIVGNGIRRDNSLGFAASIMDIAPTISYLLGIRYPSSCIGRVFLEALV